jgi:integrase
LIWIRATHPQQSVKTGPRKVPLHPAVAAEFLAYAKASKSDFIFDAFPFSKVNGRANWLINKFSAFRRDVCSITNDGLTLHSIRHRFVDACRNAGVAEERAKALVGHSNGIHGRYGQGAGLALLAADVARVNPLSDD